MTKHPRDRRGFTLIELLVVVAILAVLLSILLPAVQWAREAARLTQCKNNLKQVGLALHNYHDAHLTFPAGSLNSWSWIAQILPELDQASVQNDFNFDLNLQEQIISGENIQHTDSILPIVLCPSDPNGEAIFISPVFGGTPFAHTNYLGTENVPDDKITGMFGIQEFIRLKDVRDGSSQTLFVGERGIDKLNGVVGNFGWWIMGAPLETFMKATEGIQQGPNSEIDSIKRWWSYHKGVISFLFVDGSVKALNDSMDADTFSALGSRSGGEAITQEF